MVCVAHSYRCLPRHHHHQLEEQMSRTSLHGLDHMMEQRLVQHRGPAQVSAVAKMTVDMLTPERQRLLIERNNGHVEVIFGYDGPYVAVPPVSFGRAVFDRYTFDVHPCRILNSRPIAVVRRKMLS